MNRGKMSTPRIPYLPGRLGSGDGVSDMTKNYVVRVTSSSTFLQSPKSKGRSDGRVVRLKDDEDGEGGG